MDEDLLEAAAQEFLQRGFSDASVDRIASALGSTRPALYRRYPTKELLYQAVLNHMAHQFELDLSFLDATQSAPEVLYRFVRLFYETLSSERVTAMSRLAIAESVRFPEMMAAYRDKVTNSFMGPLQTYFQQLQERGVVEMPDMSEAVVTLMTLSGRVHARLLGIHIPPERTESSLREVVRFFLAGYAPRG
jgi:AcrR family transcriptional regulator